ncbi:toll/interleukin-1 receptor domain-containing protein [Bradyrhizobium sp. Arg62]|nr:toll/interleukin-1 receptor domain-containing protein [Bradyrhizobium brasilense]
MRIFISFSSRDREVARRLDAALRNRRPDLTYIFDEGRLQGGDYWIPELGGEVGKAEAVILLLGRSIGKWQELEYYEALQLSRRRERHGRPRIVPVAITGEPTAGLPFLATLHQIRSADPGSEATLTAIERALDAAATAEDSESWKRFEPYKGLAALTERDAAFFFGREKETADVLDTLARARGRLVTLIGHSGVGKSSLVFAGVLSRLKSQLPPVEGRPWPAGLTDSRSYLQLKMRPGREPVKELAASLVGLYGVDGPAIEEEARRWAEVLRGGSRLNDMLRQARDKIAETQGGHPPKHFILYVDQGEELYTRAPETEAAAFSRLVVDAAGDDIFTIIIACARISIPSSRMTPCSEFRKNLMSCPSRAGFLRMSFANLPVCFMCTSSTIGFRSVWQMRRTGSRAHCRCCRTLSTACGPACRIAATAFCGGRISPTSSTSPFR